MPLKRLLDECRAIDPKDAAVVFEAFDGAVAELGLRTIADREKGAKIIIRLALAQEDRDVTKLRDGTVARMRKESGARRRRPF